MTQAVRDRTGNYTTILYQSIHIKYEFMPKGHLNYQSSIVCALGPSPLYMIEFSSPVTSPIFNYSYFYCNIFDSETRSWKKCSFNWVWHCVYIHIPLLSLEPIFNNSLATNLTPPNLHQFQSRRVH